eukprot:2005912-Amphidinium_carterae.1
MEATLGHHLGKVEALLHDTPIGLVHGEAPAIPRRHSAESRSSSGIRSRSRDVLQKLEKAKDSCCERQKQIIQQSK